MHEHTSPFAQQAKGTVRLAANCHGQRERVDTSKRAKALLAIAAGQTLTQAGKESGLSREGVAPVVELFNQCGLKDRETRKILNSDSGLYRLITNYNTMVRLGKW